MNYLLFKLRFTTAVHFGQSDSALSLYTSDDHFCADTLFSALCHTALSLNGEAGVKKLCQQVKEGTLLFSDSMPWEGEHFYLPKPMKTAESREELPSRTRKAMKKLNWIPVDGMEAFCGSLRGTGSFDPTRYTNSFGVSGEVTRAAHKEGEDTMPYPVGVFAFRENCGLWFLAGYENEKQANNLETLVELLGLGGIGGKTSSGYGRFEVVDTIYLDEPFDTQTTWLAEALNAEYASCSLLMTTSLPAEEELDNALEGAFYQLTRRSGFVQSDTFDETGRKKLTQMFLCAGSTFVNRFCGELYAVGTGGKHPVYRYGKPIFLGVNL